MWWKRLIPSLLVLGVAGVVYRQTRPPTELVLTGIVTTDSVTVSPQIGGLLEKLLVKEGDAVERDQLLAVLSASELRAEQDFFAHGEEGSAEQIRESAAALRYQQQQATQQVREAEATLARAVAQRAEADANLTHAKQTLDRDEAVLQSGGVSQQEVDQARAGMSVARSRLDAVEKQIDAARAGVALARTASEQVEVRRSALGTADRQHAAAAAQAQKAKVRLGYSELHAPLRGVVDVRAARQGEVVTAGQPIVTLIDLDDLWVRADVEETYVDRLRIGDTVQVRFPSGELRTGRVFYRNVDAGFATQRDVSRVKRDIKTFEVRLRVPNADRKLAVGMTAYVLLPLARLHS